ncbi:MAG: glycosyltransferase family 39 protein [Anaerolineae bacterium]|jgi:hypothetical protein|nr:glycosyltransferase family 39 protein [Anaerolineae bacterium]MDH7473956.1 glycosyltransferase family 39 protein [Anaerolineae bacterium]
MNSVTRLCLLLLIVLLTFGLRIYRLDYQDLWGDEAYSVYVSRMALSNIVKGGVDTHPPLYHVLLHFLMGLAGDSVFALRFLPLTVSVLLVPLTYRLGQEIFDQLTGFLAAFLTATASFQVYYAQETRMYSLAAFGSTLSIWFFWRLLHSETNLRERRWRLWVGYILATAIALYSHYYAFFVLAAQVSLILAMHWRKPTHLLRWLAVFALLAVSYVPWIAVQMSFLGDKASARYEEYNLAFLGEIIWRTIAALSLGLTIRPPLTACLVPGFLVLLIAGLSRILRGGEGIRWAHWLVILWFVVPLILAWAVNPVMPFFHPRYLLICAPAWAILLAAGLRQVGMCHKAVLATGLFFVIAANTYALQGYYFDETFHKGQYGRMMAYVESHAQQNDLLLLDNPLQMGLFDYYRPTSVEAQYLSRDALIDEGRTERELSRLTTGHTRVWLVMFGNPAEYDPHYRAESWLAAHGSKAFYRGFIDATLSLFVLTQAGEKAIWQPLQANLDNKVMLLGYHINTTRISVGDALLLTLTWQALADMSKSYTVFTHLLDKDNQVWAQVDSVPVGGTYPTSEWSVGEVVADSYALLIPENTPAGEYILEVGMYELATLQRLPVVDSNGQNVDNRVVLSAIVILPGPDD